MIFDTDVFIWIQRGSKRAAQLFERQADRCIAVQTYMELLQGAQNRVQQAATRRFLKDFGVRTLSLSPEIGDRAMSLVEQYALSNNMCAGDALIAATALESAQPLCTSNVKHFRTIPLLEVVRLVP
jgi:predicted nucleic acid-binding protein